MKAISILFVFIAIISCNVHSATSGQIDILRVEVTDRWFAVYSANGKIGTEGCEDENKVVFWREDLTSGYESMLSVALAAHVAKKQITMWLTSCKPGPWSKTLPKAGTIVIL